MSQDNQSCIKCGVPCGYDEGKAYWLGGNEMLCHKCKTELANKFCDLFGLDGYSSDFMGLEVTWVDVDKILSSIQRDPVMRTQNIIVDDKDIANRELKRDGSH